MTPSVIPKGQAQDLPLPVPVPRAKRGVIKAAKESGLPVVRVKSYQDIGKVLTDEGAVELARGMYLMNLHTTGQVIARLGKMFRRKGDRAENLKILQAQKDMLAHQAVLAEKICNSAPKRKSEPDAPGGAPTLPPPGTIVNVGVKIEGKGGSNESGVLRTIRVDGANQGVGQAAPV